MRKVLAFALLTVAICEPAAAQERSRADVGVQNVFIKGARLYHAGMQQSADDFMFGTTLDRDYIARSGATTIQELIMRGLTMLASSQVGAGGGHNFSSFDLRGLGSNGTQILIDGRPAGPYSVRGTSQQPDLAFIPLRAIERIDVLPSTASSIYGGGAVGGVINVVMRKDYEGVELNVSRQGVFSGDARTGQIEFGSGFTFQDGRTVLMLAGSYSDGDPLQVRERDLFRRGRDRILANDPSAFLDLDSPPLGAVANISSVSVWDRQSTSTVRPLLELKDGTALGSAITSIPVGYEGIATDGGAALVRNAGRYNLGIADTAQGGGGGRASLTAAPEVSYIGASLSHELGTDVEVFVDLSGSNNKGKQLTNSASSSFTLPVGAPTNPFAQDVLITGPGFGADGMAETRLQQLRAVTGAIVSLGDYWTIGFDYTWNRARYSASTPGGLTKEAELSVAGGTLDLLQDMAGARADFSQFLAGPTTVSATDTALQNFAMRMMRPPNEDDPTLPAYIVQLQYREETLGEQRRTDSMGTLTDPSRAQRVMSVSMGLTKLLFPGLEVQLTGRHDAYDTAGARAIASWNGDTAKTASNHVESLNPAVGILIRPSSAITARLGWGTGFLAPSVHQLVQDPEVTYPATVIGSMGLTDPQRGNEPLGELMLRTGGNPNLEPEKSENWTAGVVLEPLWLPGLRFSIDWLNLKKTGNITQFPLDQSYIDNENVLSGLIVREVAPPGDAYGLGRIANYNAGLRNIAAQTVEALDFNLEYSWVVSRFGSFSFDTSATRLIHHKMQLTPFSSPEERAGLMNTLQFNARTTLSWTLGDWSAGWTGHYYDSYFARADHEVDPRLGSAKVPAQVYHDIYVGLQASERSTIQLTVRNALGTKPPFSLQGAYYSEWGDPRSATYLASVRMQF